MQAHISFALCILCLTSLWAGAQSGPNTTPQSDASQTSQVWSTNLGDEPVDVGDLVYISVTGSPEFTRSYRVANDGTLSMPLVKEPVPVAGMAPSDVAHAVSDALVRDRILVAPIVSAAVLEYKSRQVTVAGAVNTPTIIQATGNLKLLDAITRAHGVTPDAGAEVIVSKTDKETGTRQTTSIPIKELLAGNDPKLNIPLHGGEEVRVPEAAKLFVVGNVKAPGAYRITEPGGLSVLKAMALTQGPLPYTSKQAYIYRLVEGTKERQEITVPLRDILHRKEPDIQLQANDILYVPEGTRYTQVLGHIVGLGATVGTSGAIR